MMRGIRERLSASPNLDGLENILKEVAEGHRTPEEAAHEIRRLASKPRSSTVFASRFLKLVGALGFLVGLGFAAYSIAFSIGAREVQGTVIEMAFRGHGQSPVVEYDVNGKRFTYQSSLSSSPPAYSVGDKVTVLYRPDDPARAQINSFLQRWFFAVAFASGGFWCVVLGFFWPRLVGAVSGRG